MDSSAVPPQRQSDLQASHAADRTGTGAADADAVPAGDVPAWDFPGWGTTERIEDLGTEPVAVTHLDSGEPKKLGIWAATAICGNDITSSCLYVTAIAALYAGPYAPLSLLMVAAVLFLFRGIYAEVGTALPLNGGAYNVLLNTTSKGKASVAACLTLLSYVATAVISANEAMHYAHNLYAGLSIFWCTVGLLGFFALLNLIGISESARVALFIFLAHLSTLVLLVGASLWATGGDLTMLTANLHRHPPHNSLLLALFFGFSAAMLGISGFESSANFIEEQKPGIFPRTLNNMWLAVAIFNPLISLLAMALLPLPAITDHTNDLLAELGYKSAGRWMQTWVSIDATLVLSGAVLTSFVGVTGLMRRMSLDRCLPQFLLAENAWRHTNHWIIGGFFALCVSILVLTGGEVTLLAGVYTISFLGVMALFAVGNMLLKLKRNRLPRQIRASWPAVLVALVAVLMALIGNILLDPSYVTVFGVYFGVVVIVVALMFLRVQILRLALILVEGALTRLHNFNARTSQWLMAHIQAINNQEIVFFAEDGNPALLNAAALYVRDNEQNKRLRIVHCYDRSEDIPPHLMDNVRTLDAMYPDLRIDLLLVQSAFNPSTIERLARRLNVPKNYMFIGTPSDRFPHSLSDLGGVRLIM